MDARSYIEDIYFYLFLSFNSYQLVHMDKSRYDKRADF